MEPFRQRIKHIHRAQVGVVPEQGPKIEKTALRLLCRGKAVVLLIANGAEQHSLRTLAELDGRRRQRRIVAIDGGAADGAFDDFERTVEQAAAEFENTSGFGENFRADAVTGKKRDLIFHAGPAAAPVAVLLRAALMISSRSLSSTFFFRSATVVISM